MKTPSLKDIQKAFQSHNDFDDIEIVMDAWMVHFTNHEDALKIAKEGFSKGSEIDGFLAHKFGANSSRPGVNFSFMTSDEYAIMLLPGFDFGAEADSAVVFRGDAVRMHHYDDFYQCAFWGPSIKGPFHVLNSDDEMDIEHHEREWTLDGGNGSTTLFELFKRIEEGQIEPNPNPRRARP